jgi:hypothetical protein
LSKNDVLVDGEPDIRGQVFFPNIIKQESWIPAVDAEKMIIHPGVTLRYNYNYKIPANAAFVLLHGVLDYGNNRPQHKADCMLKVPEILANKSALES